MLTYKALEAKCGIYTNNSAVITQTGVRGGSIVLWLQYLIFFSHYHCSFDSNQVTTIASFGRVCYKYIFCKGPQAYSET